MKKQNNQLDNGINEQFSKIVELEGRNNLLKAILTEIKEIAQFACEKSVCDRNHCDYCSDGQILQKISEVEE